MTSESRKSGINPLGGRGPTDAGGVVEAYFGGPVFWSIKYGNPWRPARERHPEIRMAQTFGFPRLNWNPIDYATAAEQVPLAPTGWAPVTLPGQSAPALSPFAIYAGAAMPVALSGLGGGMFGGPQNPRPVHVAPPQFALDNVQQRLQAVLARSPGSSLGVGACLCAGGYAPGLQGLGSLAPADPVPPQLYTDSIAPARSVEEGLFQQSIANGTTQQANQAYEDARAQGASHEDAVAIAAPIAQGVAKGAGEGILGGVASIVGSILGPLAGAGTSIYQTLEQSKLAKQQAKQRQQELLVMQETRRRDQEFALAQQQQSGAFWSAHGGQVAAGAGALVLGLGALAYFSRGGKKSGKRGRR